MQDKIKIIYTEPLKLLREAMIEHFNKNNEMEIIFATDNTEEALRQFEASRSDILMTNINLYPFHGIELTRRAKEIDPHAKVLILTEHRELCTVTSCLIAGARGYALLSKTKPEGLFKIIKSINRNGMWLDPDLSMHTAYLP